MLHIFGRYFFPHIIKGDYDAPEAHLELIRELGKREDGAIIFPRGHAKSTWVKIDTLHDIVYNLEPVILYIGATITDAGFHFESMKSELENNTILRHVYGNLVPDEMAVGRKWTSKHFETSNGVNVVARGRSKGRGVNIKNQRPTKIVIDDAEDDESVKNPVQRRKFHNWLYNVIFPSKDKRRGYIKMIGTVLHEMCEVLAFYHAHGGIFRRAIENDAAIWKQMFSKDDLYRIRDGYTKPDGTVVKGIGTRAFNREYMNNAMASDEVVIREEWLDKAAYVLLPEGKTYDGYLYIDPQAGTSGLADEFAITCLYVERFSVHRYCVEQVAGRKSQLEQAKEVVRMWLRHKDKIRAVGVEKVLNQTSVWQLLQDWKARRLNFNAEGMKESDLDWIDETDRGIPIVECQPRGRDGGKLKDKVARVQLFEPDFERGELHIMASYTALREQLMFIGTENIDHDDRADSFIGALELAVRKGVPSSKDESNNLSNVNKKSYTASIAGNLMKKKF